MTVVKIIVEDWVVYFSAVRCITDTGGLGNCPDQNSWTLWNTSNIFRVSMHAYYCTFLRKKF